MAPSHSSSRQTDDVPGCFSPILSLFRSKPSSQTASSAVAPPPSASPLPYSGSPVCTSHGCSDDTFGCGFDLHPPEDDDEGDLLSGLPAYSSTSAYADEKRVDLSLALETIKDEIDEMSGKLREVNLKIHDNPELMFKEFKAHDTLTSFLATYKDVKVEKNFVLPTAIKATFSYGKGGKTVGVNSEYDALPAIGHACGHNLIAVAGLAVFLSLRKVLIDTKTSGSVVLLGTPAEEGGGGKIILLNAGAYKEMDVCLMTHPGGMVSPYKKAAGYGHVGPSLAAGHLFVNYVGQTAHASAAPWQGRNALDAANLAYSSISSLRQQILPSQRIHGIIVPPEDGWAANIIPDKAGLKYVVRSPTLEGLQVLIKRVEKCFDAAALATGCEVSISHEAPYADLKQNVSLSEEYQRVMKDLLGYRVDFERGEAKAGASTDAGNISHAMPFLHPSFPVKTTPNGSNHTSAFTAAVRTGEAHLEAMRSALGLAGVGARVLLDGKFQV